MYGTVLAAAAAFLFTLAFTPYWIKHAKSKGLVGRDMNKHHKPEVAETGGVSVFLGFIIGMLFLMLSAFYRSEWQVVFLYMASMASLSIIWTIAYIDDTSGWKKGFIRWKKPLLTFIAVLPLLPFIWDRTGITLIGIPLHLPLLFYPLVLVPIGFIGATNAVNLLGGFNGLEAGLGAVATAALMWFSWGTPFFPLMLLGFATSVAFLAYNRYPSKVFPGDTYTYFLGGLFATFAVLGQFQTATILIMAPYMLEGLIKAREIPYYLRYKKPFKPECFGRPSRDGSLKEPYREIWSLTHVFMKAIRRIKGRVYENDVTLSIISLYILWCLFIIFTYMRLLS